MEDFTPEQKQYISDLMSKGIKEQLTEHLSALMTDVTSYVDEKTAVVEQPAVEDDSTSARLKELERQLQSEKEARNVEVQERNRLSLTNKLRDELAGQGINAKSATELLTGRLFPSMTYADGNFLTKDGKNISEVVADFVATDGVDFRPKASGVGTESGNSPAAGTPKPTLESDLTSFLTW